MALTQPSKRKSAFPNSGGGRDDSAAARKRAKTYDARALAVQTSDAALSATGELDVAAFVGAREFEIRALEAGMQRSKAALTSRAFQKVPLALRRRTASHNVKRVPRRLRARAKREMIEDNTPTVTARRRKPTQLLRLRLETARRLQGLNAKTKARRAASKSKREKEMRKLLSDEGIHSFQIAPRVPKIKKNKLSHPAPAESKFKKRQRGKTWLPTHMFHAKRAHMTTAKEPLWRFAVPLSPTEKSYRPTHRAAGARGAVAWDVSYMSTIQLEGSEASLESVLRTVGVAGDEAWGTKGTKWRQGTRSLVAWVFEHEGEKKPIAPVTFIWCARSASEDVEMTDAGDQSGPRKAKKPRERLFIRVHPSAFLQLWNELLEVSKRQNPPVMVEDLRFEIGSIDITGPGATEALVGALKPVQDDGKEFPKDSPEATWSSLLGVTNPSSLPQNAILAFSISDPRLQFPPRKVKPPTSEESMNDLAILLASWPPDRTQTPAALFDRPVRLAAARQLPSQKAINRRRTLAGAGTDPSPQPSDPRIPVLVLASKPGIMAKNSNAQGTWTVLLPWKCVTPVWYSLMYHPLSSGGNPRFGGLKEQRQLAFEVGEPWFPGDFPGTQAGWQWGLREREEAKNEWERRPKGRRTEFDSIDIGNGSKGEIGRGWACDWERLVEGPPKAAVTASDDSVAQKDSDKTKDADKEAAETSKEDSNKLNTLLPQGLHQLTSTVAHRIINHLSGPLPADLQSHLDKPALATVKISLFNRGTPTPRARVYRLPTTDDKLRQQWLAVASAPTPAKTASKTNGSQSSAQKGKKQKQSQNQNQTQSTASEQEQRDEARRRLAASLLTESTEAGLDTDAERTAYLPIPPEEDLIGFVTTGNYNLSEGKGTGIGSILVSKVTHSAKNSVKDNGKGKAREQRMCIVRSAGERVGRLGVWEVV
ncbi:ribonuclease P complex subunit Pop1, putative [Paecilomyces variotii No. 5]|uniref:Ribonuclease P complex subunit Pop1, putative n=1 Tax=Byssochlamys spectabilis (strain No. 5 / NBRC 109023) TaxID=1356009 RepID=V5GAD9_BYSSN|nr:ribonuclease P complex subunit Pop1, putative [Paecilomyces variotii No. 5]